MSMPPRDVLAGSLHNDILNAGRDTLHGYRVVPGLMLSLLRDDAWKRLVRPIDSKVFTHETVAEWVLGPPWAGLAFPSWDALYAILDRAADKGAECKQLLIERGAPVNAVAEDAPKAMSREEAGKLGGRGKRSTNFVQLSHGGTDRTVARLKRDRPDLAAKVVSGELSANAAAIEAGFRHKTWTAPCNIEALSESIKKRYPGWQLVKGQ
jgi:hypothetical protein